MRCFSWVWVVSLPLLDLTASESPPLSDELDRIWLVLGALAFMKGQWPLTSLYLMAINPAMTATQ